jgi:hypothetical protein
MFDNPGLTWRRYLQGLFYTTAMRAVGCQTISKARNWAWLLFCSNNTHVVPGKVGLQNDGYGCLDSGEMCSLRTPKQQRRR